MSSTEMNQTQPQAPGTYWRSLGQLENSEEFQQILAREFPEGITEAPDEERTHRRARSMRAAATGHRDGAGGCHVGGAAAARGGKG